MKVQWDERLLKATLRRIRLWASDYPILYTVLFGVLAFAVQALITNIFLQMGNTWAGVLSLLLVPIAIVGFMLVRTLLDMLYEVREALGQHLDPTSVVADPENFSCELVDSADREVAIRVTNNDVAGEFHAKVIDLRGVESNPVPISIRWRGDESSASRRIGSGDFDVLSVVRVRGRRAVDFLEPRAGDDDAYRRVVASNLVASADKQTKTNGRGPKPGAGAVGRSSLMAGDGRSDRSRTTDTRGTGDRRSDTRGSGARRSGTRRTGTQRTGTQRIDANGGSGPSHQVEAVVRIVNRATNGEGRRSHLLKLRFENGSDVPTTELVPMAPEDAERR